MSLGALGHVLVGAEYPRPILHPPYPDISVCVPGVRSSASIRPGNVFPSLHVAHTTMLALILMQGSPAARAGRARDGDRAGAVDADHQAALHRRRLSGYALAFFGRWLALAQARWQRIEP